MTRSDLRDVRRLRLLHVIHDFLPRHRAGSEIYAAALCRALLDRHDVTLLCADYDPTRPHGHLTWRLHDDIPVVELANNWMCASFADTYRSPLVTSRIEQVLQATQPDVVHVHSLLNMSFGLPAVARARGIPVVATLHDYTLVCPSGGQRIHRAESHVCREIDSGRCARCFRQSPFYTQAAVGGAGRAVAGSRIVQGVVATARRLAPRLLQSVARAAGAASSFTVTEQDIVARLAEVRALFEQVDLFVAPSASLAGEFVRLGVDPLRMRVSDYGFKMMPRREPGLRPARLRIGFVGTLVWHKGAHVMVDAVRHLPADAFELIVHGDVTVFPDYVAELRRRAQGLPVRFAGAFGSEGSRAVYESMDVLVVPSLWLENSPLVIHEAFMTGVPVIGARMGGIENLVTDGVNGRLYDAQSPEDLASVLRDVIENRDLLSEWERALPAVKSIDDDADEWDAIYSGLTADRPHVRAVR